MENRAASGRPVNDVDAVCAAVFHIDGFFDSLIAAKRDSRPAPAIETDDGSEVGRSIDFIEQCRIDCHIADAVDQAVDDQIPHGLILTTKTQRHKDTKGAALKTFDAAPFVS